MNALPKKLLFIKQEKLIGALLFGILIITIATFGFFKLSAVNNSLLASNADIINQLSQAQKAYQNLKNQDQYKRNEKLQSEMTSIHDTYQKAIASYEGIQDLKLSEKTDTLDTQFASILQLLSDKNYASAEAVLTMLAAQIKTDNDKIAAAQAASSVGTSTTNAPSSNAPPASGYSLQKVHTDSGDFTVAIIAADLNTTRVIVDTASDSDCSNNCPVLPLSTYVARNSAFAGINGTYFCPSTYPTCAGKANSFDLLVMNKNKHYFNADNNVYSTNPAVIFSGNSARFVGQALEWGRDTGVDAVISNYPLLISNNQIVYSDSSDPKFNSSGPRGFVGATGSTVYIGFVYNATMGESAKVLHALNITNAMNLDEGGSTALWSGGYKAGPGRDIPNAILFVRK